MSKNLMLNWFCRLLIWPVALWVSVASEDASEYEVFSEAPWFVLGILCLVAPLLSLLYGKLSFMEGVSFWSVLSISVPLYIFFGIWCFFSDKVTNAPIPWQHNGRW